MLDMIHMILEHISQQCGCRTANGWDINGFGQLKDGRGNICPVTIILPTLAMKIEGEIGHKNAEAFIKKLDQKIYEAKDMLIERFDFICSQSADSAKFMYENGIMAGYIPEEGIRSALKHRNTCYRSIRSC